MNAGYGDDGYFMNATGLQSTADEFGGWLGMSKSFDRSTKHLADTRSM